MYFNILCVSVYAPFFPLNYLRVVWDTIFSFPCWRRENSAEWFWDCFWNTRKTQMYHQLLSNSIIPLYSFIILAASLRTKIFFHNIAINVWIFLTLVKFYYLITNAYPILSISQSCPLGQLPLQYSIQSVLHLAVMFLFSLLIWTVPHHLSFIIKNTHTPESRINPYTANSHMNFSNFPRQLVTPASVIPQ